MSKLTEVLKLFCYDPETDGANTFNIPKALNENWEKIDQLVLLAVAAAAAYDPEGSYAVGDYCTHAGKLHKCGTEIPDGEAWTAEHWTETTVAAELAEVRASLSNKVSKSGDTMAGTLTLKSQNAYTDNACQTTGLGFVDVSNTRTGWFGVGGNGTDICDFWLANDKGDVSLRPGINGRAKVADAEIATTTPPQQVNIIPINGWTSDQDRINGYRKNQFSEVNINIAINRSAVPDNGAIAFILPEDCRPSKITSATAIMWVGFTPYPVSIDAFPDGNVVISHNVTAQGSVSVYGSMNF